MRLGTLAGETRVEHATDGFGDRCSTIEPLPYVFTTKHIIEQNLLLVNKFRRPKRIFPI